MADTLLFLSIDSIQGEASTKGFENQIELESLTWGMEAKHTDKANKLTTELRPQRLTVTKYFDKASTNLCTHMSTAKVFAKAQISFTSVLLLPEGQQAIPVMEIFLYDGFVEDVKLQASESGNAMSVRETVQLSFRKFELKYYQSDGPRTKRGAAHVFSCDQPSAKA